MKYRIDQSGRTGFALIAAVVFIGGAAGNAMAQTWSSSDAEPPAQRNQAFPSQQNGVSSGTEVYVYPGGQAGSSYSGGQSGSQYPPQQYQRPQYPQQGQQGRPQYPQQRFPNEDEYAARLREQNAGRQMPNFNSSPNLSNPTPYDQARAAREAVRRSEAANDAAKRVQDADQRRRGLIP